MKKRYNIESLEYLKTPNKICSTQKSDSKIPTNFSFKVDSHDMENLWNVNLTESLSTNRVLLKKYKFEKMIKITPFQRFKKIKGEKLKESSSVKKPDIRIPLFCEPEMSDDDFCLKNSSKRIEDFSCYSESIVFDKKQYENKNLQKRKKLPDSRRERMQLIEVNYKQFLLGVEHRGLVPFKCFKRGF